jgi:hypothetical protein
MYFPNLIWKIVPPSYQFVARLQRPRLFSPLLQWLHSSAVATSRLHALRRAVFAFRTNARTRLALECDLRMATRHRRRQIFRARFFEWREFVRAQKSAAEAEAAVADFWRQSARRRAVDAWRKAMTNAREMVCIFLVF